MTLKGPLLSGPRLNVGLKVTGFRLYFGCILVVSWLQYNVVTTFLGVYIFTLSQRSFTTLSQPKHNQNTTLSQCNHNVVTT